MQNRIQLNQFRYEELYEAAQIYFLLGEAEVAHKLLIHAFSLKQVLIIYYYF